MEASESLQADDDSDIDSMKRQLSSTTEACQKFIKSLDSCISQIHGRDNTATRDLGQVTHLQRQVTVLEEQLSSEREQHTEMCRNQQDRWDNLIVQYKEKIQHAEDDKLQAEGENKRLKVELNRCQQRLRQAEELVASLTSCPPQPSSTAADQEKIQLLEAQLQLFREDFDSERKDRQTAQNRCAELERNFEMFKRQVYMQPAQQYRRAVQHPELGSASDYRGPDGISMISGSHVPAAAMSGIHLPSVMYMDSVSGSGREERATTSQSKSITESSSLPDVTQ